MSIVSVAKLAGVSIATVSRVINDLDNVRGETAEQVRAAMKQLGYTPPRVKRGPKTGRRRATPNVLPSGQIAVLTLGGVQNWLTLPVMASVVGGITREARDLDVWAVLDEMPDPGELSPIFRRREVDGAVVFCQPGTYNDSDLLHLHRHVPVVWVMGGEDALVNVDHVSPDNSGIGRLALRLSRQVAAANISPSSPIRPNWPIMRLRAQAFGNAARDVGPFRLELPAQHKQRAVRSLRWRWSAFATRLNELVREFANRPAGIQPGCLFRADLLLTRIASSRGAARHLGRARSSHRVVRQRGRATVAARPATGKHRNSR